MIKRHYAPNDPLITVAAVAAFLHKSHSGAWRWLRRHGVPTFQPDRMLYVRQSDVDAVLARSATGDFAEQARIHLQQRAG